MDYKRFYTLTALLGTLLLLVSGCATRRDVVYLQDVKPLAKQKIIGNYEMTIAPDDELAILVNSKEPELALPFNMPMVTYQLGSEAGAGYGTQRVVGYLVDKDGDIDFPSLGKIHAAGMTRMQLTDYIQQHLIQSGLLKDAIVTVQFLNFKISVIGEVNRPGTFNITSDRVTLLEALSMAGDLTIYGRRDRVAVIREKNGVRTVLFHDLRSSDIFQSPDYYLEQNDIVYVEPNRARAGQSSINQNNSAGVWLSAVSILVSALTLIFTLTK
ncbi:MAG: polysaccharide biosynthesis/export family protein [Tannerella sp.]|jgi:polysaccharide export outer membrane protein|nr:polysaccharide biosynthesis/export family protein [Tannerella sp.]